MGGRRARSLDEIVGSGLGAQRAIGSAIRRENADDIAASSAKLVAQSDKISDILFYASKLVGFLQEAVRSEKDLTYERREQLARQAWSRLKKEENLPHDTLVTQAIVSAAVKAIGKGRK
jgi:hypothetical protein